MKRVILLVVLAVLTVPSSAAAKSFRPCRVPPGGFFTGLQATDNVSCREARAVLAVWDHQEFPPFCVGGFKWRESRKQIDHGQLEYTHLWTTGGRSIHMTTRPYG